MRNEETEAARIASPVSGLAPSLRTDRTEYALRKVATPIGVSEYELTRALPPKFRSALPAISKIEKELSE